MVHRDRANEHALIAARGWIGTPYRHRASLRGCGADCLGLVRGVWRECVGPEPVELPIYSPRWDEADGHDVLLNAFQEVFQPMSQCDAAPGDLVVFRLKAGQNCKHTGILSALAHGHGLIHAYSRRGVVECSFDSAWRRRAAAYFRFPSRRY